MHSVRTLGNGLKQASRRACQFRRGVATNADNAAATGDADVAQARKYCLNQLRFAPAEFILLDGNIQLTAFQTWRL